MPQSAIPQKSKIEEVMTEFKKGKLFDDKGKKVTDMEKALAYALNSAGISARGLMKAELFNKVQHLRKQVEIKLQREIAKEDSQETKVLDTFAKTKVDIKKVDDIAGKLNMDREEFIEKAFSLLTEVLADGKGAGKNIEDFDPEEVSMGRLVEQEHTKNPYLIDRIVVDHLAERKDYYSFGKKKGIFDELKKSRGKR